jgi:hypothetical protein
MPNNTRIRKTTGIEEVDFDTILAEDIEKTLKPGTYGTDICIDSDSQCKIGPPTLDQLLKQTAGPRYPMPEIHKDLGLQSLPQKVVTQFGKSPGTRLPQDFCGNDDMPILLPRFLKLSIQQPTHPTPKILKFAPESHGIENPSVLG